MCRSCGLHPTHTGPARPPGATIWAPIIAHRPSSSKSVAPRSTDINENHTLVLRYVLYWALGETYALSSARALPSVVVEISRRTHPAAPVRKRLWLRDRVSMQDRHRPRRSVDPRLAHPSAALSPAIPCHLSRHDAFRVTSLQSPVHGFASHRRLQRVDSFVGDGYLGADAACRS
jgi:hypothetical protein